MIAIGALSVLNGLADAAVLVIIARAAFALTDPTKLVSLSLGPLGDRAVSIGAILGTAAGLVIAKFGSQLLVVRMVSRVTPSYIYDHRMRITRAFLRSSWALQSEERQGHLQDLVTSFTTQSATALSSLIALGVATCSLVGLLGVALVVDPPGALTVAVAVGVLGLAFRPLRSRVRAASRKAAHANLAFATATTEAAGEAQEIRVFGVGEQVQDRLDAAALDHRRAATRLVFMNQGLATAYQNVALLLLLLALLMVSALAATNLAALGGVVLILLRSLAYGQQGVVAYYSLQQSAPLLEQLQAEESRYSSAAVTSGGDPVGRIDALRFDDVTFGYEPENPVLRRVSFSTSRGEIVGIIGPSGAGKSTLVQLLLRLREPTVGQVLADGRDVAELSLEDWYRRVAFVPQQPQLFAGTVSENIAFFRLGVDSAQIEAAARSAHIHDEISRWPGSYGRPLGEQGTRVSGGQRQRLCIARALVGTPDVVVFDEPTSALDLRSESLIRETLVQLSDRATVFIVAHRMSTLKICDRIMVLQDGELRGFDRPDRLEASNPFYSEVLQLSGLR